MSKAPNAARTGSLRRRLGGERGSAAVEITLATPLLVLLLVFVGVFTHRGVDARLRMEDAAGQAARAASLTRSPAAAASAATSTGEQALAQAGLACPHPAIATDTADFRPGGVVTVTITCRVDLTGADPLPVGAGRDLTATAASPIDTWRGTTTIGGTP